MFIVKSFHSGQELFINECCCTYLNIYVGVRACLCLHIHIIMCCALRISGSIIVIRLKHNIVTA